MSTTTRTLIKHLIKRNSSITRLYTSDHEWVTVKDNIATVGITDYAQNALGDIVFLESPAIGTVFAKQETLGAVESVKAASDIYAPLSGEIVGVNEKLENEPSLLNSSPLEDGWIVKIKLSDLAELDSLLKEDEYMKLAV